MSTFSRVLKGFGQAFAAVAVAAMSVFRELQEVAEAIRRLKPLGHEGWAISTYGLMLAPQAHRRAGMDGIALEDAAQELEDAWSDPALRRQICSIVPWVYQPEYRAVGRRRQELLERASDRFSEGSYEEAVLLVYSQVDGLFQDRAAEGDAAFSRLFSRRAVRAREGEAAETVRRSCGRVEKPCCNGAGVFLLAVRDQMVEPVLRTTLGDHPSRHGVLHGRVLGFGTRRRAAQAFAFLAAALELLVASWPDLPLTDPEEQTLMAEAPSGLQLILQARMFSPVRAVYLAGRESDRDFLIAVEQAPPRP